MSKVVHLSNEAHQRAKEYCNEHGLKMSDWVAELIIATVAGGAPPTVRQAAPEASAPVPNPAPRPASRPVSRPASTPRNEPPVAVHGRVAVIEKRSSNGGNGPKKKSLTRIESRPQLDETGAAPWEAPPFWAHNNND